MLLEEPVWRGLPATHSPQPPGAWPPAVSTSAHPTRRLASSEMRSTPFVVFPTSHMLCTCRGQQVGPSPSRARAAGRSFHLDWCQLHVLALSGSGCTASQGLPPSVVFLLTGVSSGDFHILLIRSIKLLVKSIVLSDPYFIREDYIIKCCKLMFVLYQYTC